MKPLRLCLLLLLALLLPLRGTLAAAMLCPSAGAGTQHEMHGMDHSDLDAMAAAAPTDSEMHDHAHHEHGSSGTHDDGPSHNTPDKCNLCSACCSATPLISSAPALAMPQNLAFATFAAIAAPAPSFLSDGQERPPRSI